MDRSVLDPLKAQRSELRFCPQTLETKEQNMSVNPKPGGRRFLCSLNGAVSAPWIL
jgi:hypothetical protein